jgi:molybdopterin-guanine dinucleotide biosynthesis protein A
LIAGFVLAGGASRRMGRDKALLEVHGEALAQRLARVLTEAGCDPVRIVGNQPELASLGLPVVPDPPDAPRHPLSGVVAALALVGGGHALFVPCDLPSLQADDVRSLLGHGEPVEGVVAGRRQPLLGTIPASWAPRLEVCARDGDSARRALAHRRPISLPDRAAVNVNTPAELDMLLAETGEKS